MKDIVLRNKTIILTLAAGKRELGTWVVKRQPMSLRGRFWTRWRLLSRRRAVMLLGQALSDVVNMGRFSPSACIVPVV